MKKSPKTSEPVQSQPTAAPEEKETQVAALAYAIWEDAGRPDGKAIEHWSRAQEQVETENARADQVRSQLPRSHLAGS